MALNKRIYYVRETVKKVVSQRWDWEVQWEVPLVLARAGKN